MAATGGVVSLGDNCLGVKPNVLLPAQLQTDQREHDQSDCLHLGPDICRAPLRARNPCSRLRSTGFGYWCGEMMDPTQTIDFGA